MPTLWYIRYSRSYLYTTSMCRPSRARVGYNYTVEKLCDMIIASDPQHRPETNEIFASVCLFTVL